MYVSTLNKRHIGEVNMYSTNSCITIVAQSPPIYVTHNRNYRTKVILALTQGSNGFAAMVVIELLYFTYFPWKDDRRPLVELLRGY